MIDYSKITMPQAEVAKYSFTQPPSNIIFYNTLGDEKVEVLRITKDGITANPDVPTDEAADAVIRALDGYIKNLRQRTWVGLTLADKEEYLAQDFGGNRLDAMDWADKRLKDKNT